MTAAKTKSSRRAVFAPASAILLGTALAVVPGIAHAQARGDTLRPPVEFNDRGITFNARDGFTSLNLRFRLQDWIVATTEDDGLHIARTQFAARRMRLRLEGVVWDPRLSVNVQLSFARGDQDTDLPAVVNVIRDAVVRWRPNNSLTLSAGQTKLPANRQRMTSSGELQFADRSIVNATFPVERDVGIFAAYEQKNSTTPVNLRLAVTGGEGRNPPTGDAGLAYTARVEFLPLGSFTANGDFVEGDLARESKSKLALGASVSRNDGAVRTSGQFGKSLFQPRGITTAFADAIYKRAGFSASAEYARRSSPNPVTTSGTESRYVFTGEGITAQTSYLLHSRFEPALRFSQIAPHPDLAKQPDVERQREVSTAMTRYLKGHRVKAQWEIIHDEYWKLLTGVRRTTWTARTSLEVGI